MAFPGTYNISYYKGDTFEFLINPKDTSGAPFSLTGYSEPRFTISNYAGPEKYNGTAGAATKISIEGFAKSENGTAIKCAITPDNALNMVAGTSYVYDVEISKPGDDYDYIYTLLSGKISVQEQVSLPVPSAVPSATFEITAFDDTSITVTWVAPTGGPAISGYSLFSLKNPGSTPDFTQAILKGTVSNTTFEYTFVDLDPASVYGLGVAAFNSAGLGTPATTGGMTAPA
jgi:hypothetical protein